MTDILVLDPCTEQALSLVNALKSNGLDCRHASTAKEGTTLIAKKTPDLAVMSVQLFWRDCRDILHRLEKKKTPVLFISCASGNESHVRSLYHGPCAVMPEGIQEEDIVSLCQTLLHACPGILCSGGLRMDVDRRTVTLNGSQKALTAQEFELLRSLMLKPNEILSREELLRTAWGFEAMGITRTVDVHIQRLRRKLGRDLIETVYQAGYRLTTA